MNQFQRGKFRINGSIIREEPDDIAETFSMIKFVPVTIEYDMFNDIFKYMGISEKFNEIEDDNIPEYYLHITKNHHKKITKV